MEIIETKFKTLSWEKRLGSDIYDSLKRYEDKGIPTGTFLKAVLANDLMTAVGYADDESMRKMAYIVQYIYNEMIGTCHGSYDKVKAYMESKK